VLKKGRRSRVGEKSTVHRNIEGNFGEKNSAPTKKRSEVVRGARVGGICTKREQKHAFLTIPASGEEEGTVRRRKMNLRDYSGKKLKAEVSEYRIFEDVFVASRLEEI